MGFQHWIPHPINLHSICKHPKSRRCASKFECIWETSREDWKNFVNIIPASGLSKSGDRELTTSNQLWSAFTWKKNQLLTFVLFGMAAMPIHLWLGSDFNEYSLAWMIITIKGRSDPIWICLIVHSEYKIS